jgi:hypothetical protein
VKFFFLSAGTRRLDLAITIRRMLGINNSLLGLRPRSVQRDVSIYLSLDSKWEQV